MNQERCCFIKRSLLISQPSIVMIPCYNYIPSFTGNGENVNGSFYSLNLKSVKFIWTLSNLQQSWSTC